MMNTLVCTVCTGVRVETSRSVVLPFVCEPCQSKQKSAYPADGYDEQVGEQVNLSDETATTSATIELISDLESQLALSKEVTAGQTEIIEALEKQIVDLQGDLKFHSASTERLVLRLEELIAAEQALDAIGAIAHALAFHYGFVSAKAQQLEKENELLKKALDLTSFLSGINLRVIAS